MNSVNIIGRLTRDPELRYSQAGKAVANMSIAVQRNREEADFFDCVAFEKTAETIANNLVKGREVGVSGRLQQDRWEDQQGQKRTTVKIMVNLITFIGPKNQDNQPPAQQRPQVPPQGYQQQPPGYIPPSQGGYQQPPQGYPGQQPPQGPPPGQWQQQQPPAGPPGGQPPQGQFNFQNQNQQQQPPSGGGYQGNIDNIPF